MMAPGAAASVAHYAMLPSESKVAPVEITPDDWMALIEDRVRKGGAPSRSEAEFLGIPKERAERAEDRRQWYLGNHPVKQTTTIQETDNAEQIEETGENDAGGGPQPDLRPEARNTAVGGEGVRPGGQEPETVAAETGAEGVKSIEQDANQENEPAPQEQTTPEPTEPAPKLSQYDKNVIQYAEERGYDPVDFHAQAVNVHKALSETYDARLYAKQRAHALTGLSRSDVALLVNKGFDYSSGPNVPGRRGQALKQFDVLASRIVDEYPEVFDANARKNPSQAFWDLMYEETHRKNLRIDDPSVLKEVEAAMRKTPEEQLSTAGNAGMYPGLVA